MHTYSDGKYVYSVDMMFAYVNNNKEEYKKTTIKIGKNKYNILEDKIWQINEHVFSPIMVLKNPKKYVDDYKRIEEANLKYPIFISGSVIIDGYHRFTKAVLLKKKTISAFKFSKKLLNKFKIGNLEKETWKEIDKLECWNIIELYQNRF